MKVSLLWHIGHRNASGADGTPVHVDGEDVFIDEQDGDDVKLLGVYSSRAKAEERVRRARTMPGFADEPECFVIDDHVVDEDEWPDGFVTVALPAPATSPQDAENVPDPSAGRT